MRISAKQYFDGSKESVEKAFDYIPRIIKCREQEEEKPYLKDLYYARGILRNRLGHVNEWRAIDLMETVHLLGLSTESIKQHAKEVESWTQFVEDYKVAIRKMADEQ